MYRILVLLYIIISVKANESQDVKHLHCAVDCFVSTSKTSKKAVLQPKKSPPKPKPKKIYKECKVSAITFEPIDNTCSISIKQNKPKKSFKPKPKIKSKPKPIKKTKENPKPIIYYVQIGALYKKERANINFEKRIQSLGYELYYVINHDNKRDIDYTVLLLGDFIGYKSTKLELKKIKKQISKDAFILSQKRAKMLLGDNR